MKNTNAQTAWRITLLYALLVTLWLFVSDHLFDFFALAPQQVTRLAIYHSVIFVAVTALVVYALVLRVLRLRSTEGFATPAITQAITLAVLPTHVQQ